MQDSFGGWGILIAQLRLRREVRRSLFTSRREDCGYQYQAMVERIACFCDAILLYWFWGTRRCLEAVKGHRPIDGNHRAQGFSGHNLLRMFWSSADGENAIQQLRGLT